MRSWPHWLCKDRNSQNHSHLPHFIFFLALLQRWLLSLRMSVLFRVEHSYLLIKNWSGIHICNALILTANKGFSDRLWEYYLSTGTKCLTMNLLRGVENKVWILFCGLCIKTKKRSIRYHHKSHMHHFLVYLQDSTSYI